MRYGELIHFEPVEEIIELRSADDRQIARHLVKTFVISDRLADQLTNLVIPHLRIDAAGDTKGLLVVGNYGTGKSHLMSVLSAIAEHKELNSEISNPAVAEHAKVISGRFKVVRVEIGAVAMPLRDIISQELERHLADFGVSFSFPSAATVTNNKDAFVEMMGAFEANFPGQGLLLVVDELLDYLRTRKDQELVLDLGFLREVGEVCKNTRFRFMAGVQESLFDSPRFSFVAESVRRVKDRFEQIRIAREDVAYVVAQRLLRKDSRQQALIREHLLKFAPLYGSMNERMDEFVRLFPVHPAYLDTFEQVYVAEKREVLKTLTRAIRELVGKDVPSDEPGLIAYDSYWKNLTDNPSFRAVPEIKEVIDRSSVLESRIQQAYPRAQYKLTAVRVIHALSVHRLTTNDIYARIGATAEELRDNLCLLLPVPEKDPEFLRTMIEKVLKDIITTVSGQFISFNPDNGQYHLDLKKDVDFDALIAKRSESIDASELDRFYFEALRQVVLENPAAREHVTGYRIWEHEIEWREKKATRAGYLFFGAPNERSTAQPPRDFYIYFVQPFDPPSFKDEKKADEVFFRLKSPDEEFARTLKLYAGAREQSVTASGANKKIYEEKAGELLRALTRWLRQNMASAIEVTHAGRSRALSEVIHGKVRPAEADNVRDLVNAAGSLSLAGYFHDTAPEYPEFVSLVTKDNRPQAAQEALRWIAGSTRTRQGASVLDALELIEGEQLRPRESRYARDVLDRLTQKGEGQVLNRAELLRAEAPGLEYWSPGRFRLEPEFLVVVLGSLVYAGEIVLSVPGKKFDAASMDQFSRTGLDELTQFKHIEHPKDLPLAPLQELFDLLGINKGLLVNPATRDQAAVELVTAATHRVNQVVQAEQNVRANLTVWARPVLAETEQTAWLQQLGDTKQFLESLQPYNTAGKLKNFRHETATVSRQKSGFQLVRDAEDLVRLLEQLRPITGYLETAEMTLPIGSPWLDEVAAARTTLIGKLTSPKHRADTGFQRGVMQQLGDLKARYQDTYLALHETARLGSGDDKRKGALNTDARLRQLQRLASVEGMPKQQLSDFQDRLHALRTCFALTRKELDNTPSCPHCGFRPAEEPVVSASASAVLDRLDMLLDELVQDWTRTLLADLQDPIVVSSIGLLGESEGGRALSDFLATRDLPDPVDPVFVKALQEVLSGLEGIPISQETLFAALAAGGVRCTVGELRARLDAFVQELTKGKDVSRVRIVLE
jgi:hypothetical protein